jgi:putative phosphoribosyl transferase
MSFLDRRDAGRRLGAELARRDLPSAVVIALPRGGVPVGAQILNQRLLAHLGITAAQLEAVAAEEHAELERHVRHDRGDRPAVPVDGRLVVLVDDGLATGFTARTAIAILRWQGAGSVVLAVPVAPRSALQDLRAVADDVVPGAPRDAPRHDGARPGPDEGDAP